MLHFHYIGPGPSTNYLAGYTRPGTKTFVALAICSNERQAKAAVRELRKEAKERADKYNNELRNCGIPRGFYDDGSMM
jgi:hypothetical protein